MGVLDSLSWNYPSWSISVEYYTYLLFFAVLWVGFGRRWLWSVLLSAAAFAAMFAISRALDKSSILASYDYGFIRCVASFFAGVALYEFWRRMPPKGNPLVMTVLEVAVLGVSAWLVMNSVKDGIFQFASILSFVLLIYVFSVSGGAVSRVLSLAPFRFLGRVSFSIYMIHAIIPALAGYFARNILGFPQIVRPSGGTGLQSEYAVLINLALLLLVIGLSHLTYVHVEQRGQRWMQRLVLRRAAADPSASAGR